MCMCWLGSLVACFQRISYSYVVVFCRRRRDASTASSTTASVLCVCHETRATNKCCAGCLFCVNCTHTHTRPPQTTPSDWLVGTSRQRAGRKAVFGRLGLGVLVVWQHFHAHTHTYNLYIQADDDGTTSPCNDTRDASDTQNAAAQHTNFVVLPRGVVATTIR